MTFEARLNVKPRVTVSLVKSLGEVGSGLYRESLVCCKPFINTRNPTRLVDGMLVVSGSLIVKVELSLTVIKFKKASSLLIRFTPGVLI